MPSRKTILDAVVDVLQRHPHGASAKEILEAIQGAGLYDFKAKDPVGVIRGAIRKHLRAAGEHAEIEQPSRDRFVAKTRT
jgi:hypothetical protein